MKALVGAFNQEKALVGAFSVIMNLRMELFQALVDTMFQHATSPLHTVWTLEWRKLGLLPHTANMF